MINFPTFKGVSRGSSPDGRVRQPKAEQVESTETNAAVHSDRRLRYDRRRGRSQPRLMDRRTGLDRRYRSLIDHKV